MFSWSDTFLMTFGIMVWFVWRLFKYGQSNPKVGDAANNVLINLVGKLFK